MHVTETVVHGPQRTGETIVSTSKPKSNGKTHNSKTQQPTPAPKGKPTKKDDAVELDDEVLERVRGGGIVRTRMYREGPKESSD